MADYHPLIARAVAGLEKNTGEARRALYERARTALVAQLRGVVPPLEEAEITRERLALEESIRKVEAEAARQSRFENRPATTAPRPPRPAAPPPRPEQTPPTTPESFAEAKPLEPPAAPAPPRPRAGQEPRKETPQESHPEPAHQEPSVEPPPSAPVDLDAVGAPERKEPRVDFPPRPAARSRAPGERSSSLSDAALKGFREGLSAASAEPSGGRPSHSPYTPSAVHDFDRLDTREGPQIDPEALEALSRSTRAAGIEPSPELSDARPVPSRPRPPQPQRAAADDAPPEEKAARSLKGLVIPILSLVIILALCGAAVYYRATIFGIYQAFMGPSSSPVARDTTAPPTARPKISDRIGPGAQDQTQPGQSAGSAPAVAQRVVLYEEEPTDPAGKRYVGSVIWRTETVSPGPGQPPELAVKADVSIPERQMTMTWSIRRNTDKALPASHTIEIMFNLPPDFAPGGINNVPGILMKQAEQTRGTPLAGLAVKVTTNFFLIGLSAVDADLQRNLQLLKERAWFDIPVVYNNNRRAILALEKGTPGERAFEEAFAAWKQ